MTGNAVLWFEVVGTDGAKLRTRYGDLFGWQVSPGDAAMDDTAMDDGLVAAEKPGIGGGIGRSEDGGPGHVTSCVEVDDPTAYLDKAQQLGGTVIAPPMETLGWNLTIALFADLDGHVIGLSKGVGAAES